MRKIKDLCSASRAVIVDLKFFKRITSKKYIHLTLFTSLEFIKLNIISEVKSLK